MNNHYFYIMRKIILSFLLILSFAVVYVSTTSCESGNKQKVPTLGKAQSAPYELLLVANKDWLKTMAGQTLSVVLESPIEGLPQPETHFRITKINPQAFDGTFLYYANVLRVKIGKEYKEPKVSVQHDAYCRSQLIINLEAPDDESFIALVRERAELILQMFDDREISRERVLLEKTYSGKVQQAVKKMFNADIHVPKDIDDIKQGKNFIWASDSKNEFRLNVCVYSLPLEDLTAERFVEMRDSLMKINIPGRKDNQWMETDPRSITYRQFELENNNLPVFQIHGLWDMKNDAMGGPMVSNIYIDEANNRYIVAEGFIFAPQEEKRAMLRELEAAIQTITY